MEELSVANEIPHQRKPSGQAETTGDQQIAEILERQEQIAPAAGILATQEEVRAAGDSIGNSARRGGTQGY
jgi:hypothetical protein